MEIFDKSNYIINTGITEQVFQRTAKVILLAKMIKLWTFYENVVHRLLHRHYQESGVNWHTVYAVSLYVNKGEKRKNLWCSMIFSNDS